MPKLVEYGESVIEFPDDASEADILEVLKAQSGSSAEQSSVPAAEALKEPHNYEPATPPVAGNRTPIFGPGLPIPYPTTAAAPPLPSPLSPEPFVAIPKAPPVEQVPPTAVEKGLLSGNLLGVGAEKLLGQEGAVQLGRSGVNLAGSLPEFLTSPLGITATAVGRVAPTLVAGAFAVDTLRKLPDAIADVAENWGEMTKPQKIDAITQLAGQTALGVGLGVHTVKGGLKAGERFAAKREAAAQAKTEPAGPGPIPEATPEEVAAVKAKIDELKKAEQPPVVVPVEQPAPPVEPPVQPPVEQATQPTPVKEVTPDAQEVQRKEAVVEQSTPPARRSDEPTASPVAETPPTTKPSEAGGVNTFRQLLDRFDASDSKLTERDVAAELDSNPNLPQPLRKAVDQYKQDLKEDREQFGMRSGAPETSAAAMMSELEKVAGKPAAAPKATVAPVQTVDVSPITNAKTAQEAKTIGGRMVIQAKSMEEISQIQEALKKWNKPAPTAQPTAPNDTQARQNVPSGQPQGTQPGNLSKQETGGEAAKAGGVLETAQQVEPKPEDIIGMGGAVPSEFNRLGASPAATHFRAMDEARVSRGLEPLLKPESVSDASVLQRAYGAYDTNPAGADSLADALIKKPRPIEDWENNYLLMRWIDTREEFYKSAKRAQEADADGRVADMAAANEQTSHWSDRMSKLEQALRLGGSESGRALRSRRVLINEDFSLAGLETRRRSALGGRPLTTEERSELIKIADDYKRTADALQSKIGEEVQARQRAEEVLRNIQREATQAPKYDKRILDYAERIVVRMESAADLAGTRLRERLSRLSVGIDPTIISDAAIVGAAKIARFGLDQARFIDSMVKDFGEKIHPYLTDIWKASNKVLEENLKPVPDKVRRAVKNASTPQKRASWAQTIKERIENNEQKDITGLIKKIARSFVEEGVRGVDPLVDAVHGIIRQIVPEFTRRQTMDAISGYGDFSRLTKTETAVVLRDLKGQMQQIAKLEDMASGAAPRKSGFERRTPSDAERRLIQQVEEAKKHGGYTVTDPEMQLKTALDSAKKRLENQISDLESQIASREKIVKQRTKLQYDDKYNELKARRDALKETFDEVFPKEPMTEAERLVRWKSHLDRRIAAYEERVATQDFEPRKRREPPAPDAEALEKMDRLEKIKEQFYELLLRDKYRRMHGAEKAWLLTKEALHVPRNVMTSADVSAVLRQGGLLAGSHPLIALRTLKPMFQGLLSEKHAGIIEQQILNRPNAKSGTYAQGGLYLAPLRSVTMTAMEEQIMSRFAHHIPLVRASNRAFMTFLNVIRADAFDALKANLERGGEPLSPIELQAIGNYINVATGRGKLGQKYNVAAEAMASVFFSPRLLASRFQYLAGEPMWKGTARTRKAIGLEYARTLIAAGVVLSLGAIAGATVELDPRSSDFGKMKFGNTRVDMLAGLSQVSTFMARTGAVAANIASEMLTGKPVFKGETKTQSGQLKKLRGPTVRYGDASTATVIGNFLRGKLSPVIGGAVDVLAGKNIVGDVVTPGTVIGTVKPLGETAGGVFKGTALEKVPVPVPGSMLTPISFQEIFDLMKENGVPAGSALFLLSLFGAGVNTYQKKKTVAY